VAQGRCLAEVSIHLFRFGEIGISADCRGAAGVLTVEEKSLGARLQIDIVTKTVASTQVDGFTAHGRTTHF
jgi:hypothetical protein